MPDSDALAMATGYSFPIGHNMNAASLYGGTAIQQIKDKVYDDKLEHYRRDLLFVGINYDPNTKVYECRIEEMVI